jgi:hypothetical protein
MLLTVTVFSVTQRRLGANGVEVEMKQLTLGAVKRKKKRHLAIYFVCLHWSCRLHFNVYINNFVNEITCSGEAPFLPKAFPTHLHRLHDTSVRKRPSFRTGLKRPSCVSQAASSSMRHFIILSVKHLPVGNVQVPKLPDFGLVDALVSRHSSITIRAILYTLSDSAIGMSGIAQ